MNIGEGNVPSTVPDYLNKNFFIESLRNGLNRTDIEIVDFKITMGTNAGDNYTSSIYRVKVTYKESTSQNQTLSLIVKSMPMDGDRAFLEEIDVYEKEKKIYFEILPKMHQILKRVQLAPTCYYAIADPIRTIVFDDMKERGFKMGDRQIGLDELSFAIVLNKIGKFHAISMDFLRKDPKLQQQYKQGMFAENVFNTAIFQSFFRMDLKKAARMVLEMPGYEHFADKLMTIYDNFVPIIRESIAIGPFDLKVLNHGDLWVNNIMFKYDEATQTPIDAVFLDFQASNINSPGVDLNYFFNSSAPLDVLERKIELIENYYYPSLAENLEAIGYEPIPTLDMILDEVRKREMYGLFIVFGTLPLTSMDKEESKTNNYNQFTDEDIAERKRTVGMSSKRFIDVMKYSLKYFEKLNTIDEAIRKLKI